MSTLWKLTWTQAKLYLREPIATFFTIAYAPLLLILFGAIYGNEPQAIFGNLGSMDVSVPAYTGLIILSVGIMGLPAATSSSREQGILRRYRATPLKASTYLVADVLVYYLMTLIGVMLLFLVGKLVYSVQFTGEPISVFIAFSLATLCMFSLGFLISGLAPSARIAQTIGMVLGFPMMFLSGAGMPLELLPESVQKISRFIPLTYAVKLLRGLWFGDSWHEHLVEVVILLAVLTVSTFIAAKTFRWE